MKFETVQVGRCSKKQASDNRLIKVNKLVYVQKKWSQILKFTSYVLNITHAV